MIRGRRAAQLVPADMTGDVLVERRQFAVRPVLVEDVELQRVALDPEIVERRHRVRVVARAADHAAQRVADLLDDEVLFRRADPEYRCTANREFVGVGLAAVRSPVAAIIIGILTCRRAREREHGNEHHELFHERLRT